MKAKYMFMVFGLIQTIALGFIIWFLLGDSVGIDTRLVLSLVFSTFTLIVEWMTYIKN